jgi:hypothetical protein
MSSQEHGILNDLFLPPSHLHENFLYPVSINSEGRYNVPLGEKVGYSIEM